MTGFIDISPIPENAYKMAEIIETGNYQDILYFEIHEEVNESEIANCKEGLAAFQELAKEFNRGFLSYNQMDDLPADIHIAVKVAGEWYIAKDCGANYYLGYGPMGILKIREACSKKAIVSIIFEGSFDKWVKNKFARTTKVLENKPKNKASTEFQRICKRLEFLTIDMQTHPEQFQNLSEENIRDRMLVTLNPIFHRRCHAESKSRKGKTDILIRAKNGLSEYIFELKVWDGLKTFDNAINQLSSYLSWHNELCGLIIISYAKNFSDVLDKTKNHIIKKFRNFRVGPLDNELSFRMLHQTDVGKWIEVRVFLINLCN